MAVLNANGVKEVADNLRKKMEAKASDTKITHDYDMFKLLKYNRGLSTATKHVERLCESIKEKNMLSHYPILVTQDMEVIDGQHRLEACKILGEAVHYRIVESFDPMDVVRLNRAQEPWKPHDYLNYYAMMGNEHYIKLKNFVEKEKFPLSGALILLDVGLRRQKMRMFRAGLFKWPEEDGTFKTRLEGFKRIFDVIKDKSVTIPKWISGATFYIGTAQFLSRKDMDLELFLKKLEEKVTVLRRCHKVSEQSGLLRDIYNYKLKADQRLAPQEEDSIDSRNPVQTLF